MTPSQFMDEIVVWGLSKLVNGYRYHVRGDAPATQTMFHKRGIWFLPTGPMGYYAALPTPEEVRASFEYRGPTPPYLAADVFDAAKLRAFFLQLIPYAKEFHAPERGDLSGSRFFWENFSFSGLDAYAYYAIVRHLRPKHIIEIGAGFSTMIAAMALDVNGEGCITCIEPYPRQALSYIPKVINVIQKPVQDVRPEFFRENLQDGDILFIDSTHTVKTGSDCVYEYIQILPALQSGVVIHAHDIFLPHALPVDWQIMDHRYWTEQYILLAMLRKNPCYEVLYGSQYHQTCETDLVRQFAGDRAGVGASFWFRRTDREPDL